MTKDTICIQQIKMGSNNFSKNIMLDNSVGTNQSSLRKKGFCKLSDRKG